MTLLLFSVFVCGSLYILSALIDRDQHTIDTLVNMYSYYLPFLYSCVRSVTNIIIVQSESSFGFQFPRCPLVAGLYSAGLCKTVHPGRSSLSPIVSSPYHHCFLQVAELVTRQQFLSDLTEEYQVAVMEEAAVKKQLDSKGASCGGEMTLANGYDGSVPSVRGIFLSNDSLYFSGAEYLQIKYSEAVTKREIIGETRPDH